MTPPNVLLFWLAVGLLLGMSLRALVEWIKPNRRGRGR